MKEEEQKCPHCGNVVRAGNFCQQCGGKLRKVCSPCWVLHKEHDCGQETCPGYNVILRF